MKRLIALMIAACLLPTLGAHSQTRMSLTGTGSGSTVAAYQGPGDFASGAQVWVGMRAFTNAIAVAGTQKLVNVTRASDSTNCDLIVDAVSHNGKPGVTASCTGGAGAGANGLSINTFCNATTCTAITWYDQSGNGNDQSAGSNFPTVTVSALNSLPCLTFNGTSNQLFHLTTPAITNATTGFSYAAVASGAGATQSPGGDVSNGVRFGYTAGPNFGVFAGTAYSSQTAVFSTFESLQAVVNPGGTACFAVVNGSAGSTSSCGTSNFTGVDTGNDPNGDWLNGNICEAGVWNVAFAPGQYGNINTNARAYWNF